MEKKVELTPATFDYSGGWIQKSFHQHRSIVLFVLDVILLILTSATSYTLNNWNINMLKNLAHTHNYQIFL